MSARGNRIQPQRSGDLTTRRIDSVSFSTGSVDSLDITTFTDAERDMVDKDLTSSHEFTNLPTSRPDEAKRSPNQGRREVCRMEVFHAPLEAMYSSERDRWKVTGYGKIWQVKKKFY